MFVLRSLKRLPVRRQIRGLQNLSAQIKIRHDDNRFVMRELKCIVKNAASYECGMKSFSTVPPLKDEEELEASSSLLEVDSEVDELEVLGRESGQDVDEEDKSYLRTKLYEPESDETGTISRLYEVMSVQELFDVISDCSEVSADIASQALITLWDLQKLLYHFSPIFVPEQEISNKAAFINDIKASSLFKEKILKIVMEQHKRLNDEALCSSLLALKKMRFSQEEIDPLIEECVRRKETLSLEGLSKLSVSLRSNRLWILAEFSPRIAECINTMKTNEEVRQVSILVRNSQRVLSDTIYNSFVAKLENFIETGVKFETVTYCKLMACVIEYEQTPQSLIHKLGYILLDNIDEIELVETLSLQKFLTAIQEPYKLTEALIAKNLYYIEAERDNPRIDLLYPIVPLMKTTEQKEKIAKIATQCMERNDFVVVQGVLFPLIRSLRVKDRTLYNTYWNKVMELVETNEREYFHRTIFAARNYLSFTHSFMFSYRNASLESVLKRRLHDALDNYTSDNPTVVLSPTDFASLMAFLIAFDQDFLDLKHLSKLEDFSSQLKIGDLAYIARGVDCALISNRRRMSSKRYDIISEVCSILEGESAQRLFGNKKIHRKDLTLMCRIITIITKIRGESPLLNAGMTAFIHQDVHDSKEIREMCALLYAGNYYYSDCLEAMSNYVFENLDHVHPAVIDRFLGLTYAVGWENSSFDFGKLSEKMEAYWNQLDLGVIQCGITLGFHHNLEVGLINKIFTVDFLDFIDQELLNIYGKPKNYPLRLRISLMELNRIVCLDVPQSGLPWFHDKFCQNLLSQGRLKPTYLHKEVLNALNDLLGEGAVESNVCEPSDYYYNIDFVIKFDQADRPIKSKPAKRFSFSKNVEVDQRDIQRKVAVLIMQNSAYTKHERNLKGGFKLKQRHLEMLGYKVVKVDPVLWNSMYMSELSVKQLYLESQIFNNPVLSNALTHKLNM